MINRVLISCLRRNKRLIIPNLGAIIRKKLDGVGVLLVFVPFLNKDDGILLKAIQEWAATDSEEEAQEILNEYVAAIKNTLATRGQYIIEGIGVLKYDQNNILYLAKEGEATPAPVPTTKFKVEEPTSDATQQLASAPEEEAPQNRSFNPLVDKVLDEEIAKTNDETTQLEEAEETLETTTAEVDIAEYNTESDASETDEVAEDTEEAVEETVEEVIEPETTETTTVSEDNETTEEEVSTEESEPTQDEESNIAEPEEEKEEVTEVEPVSVAETTEVTAEPVAEPISETKPEPKTETERPRVINRNHGSIKTGVGARYFSQSSSSDDNGEARRATLNSLYPNNPEARGVDGIKRQEPRRDPKKLNSIYGISTTKESEAKVEMPAIELDKPKEQEKRKTPIKKAKKGKNQGKNNDIVLIVAIIAVIVTIGVLLYGYMYGSELPLPEPLIETTLE